jgi:hypothetical protein
LLGWSVMNSRKRGKVEMLSWSVDKE